MASDDQGSAEDRRAGPTDPTLPAKAEAQDPSSLAEVRLPSRYQALGLLGGGGMGHVVRALDRQLGREVAIKSLAPALQCSDGLERLRREARAIAGLRHPAIVSVYDIDVDAGILVMELVSAGSLAEVMQREGKLGTERSLRIMRQVLAALQATHEAGIVHRDVKPSNILLEADDAPKLCDFGVVHTLDSDLTQEGMQPGTPAYMAPEQRDGGRADERADVYSAGATLFEMLTGRRFKNEVSKSRAALAAVMRAEGVEAWLADAVAWAVDEQPDQRPQSARALLDALEGPPRSSSRGRSALIGVGAIAAVAVGVALTLQSRDDVEAAAGATALDPRMVAFVPFAEETGDETLAFTAHGVPRALGTRLHAAVPSAHVLGYDALRDVLPPGEHGRDAWIDVARERGADVIVAGSVDDAAEGVTIRCDLLRSSSGPSFERAGVVSVSGRTADIDGLIAEAAAAVAERLYGERPSAEALGSIHALEALRGHQHGVDALRRARFNEAVESLEDVVSLEPDYPEAWYHLSIARTWLGGVGQRDAFRAIDRALALVEGRREQTLLRAMRLMTEERPTEAAELLEPLRADYPRDRDVLYTLGEAYHHGGDVAAGLSAFRAALRVSPGFLPSVVHPIRVYQARRDEQNARECIAIRRTYGEDDMAAHDEHILDFALGRYDEILERPIPQGPVYTRRGAMLAQIGALLVKGEDDRARGLLVGGMGELRHTVIQWNAATLLAAIAYRRQDRAAVRRFTGAAALWASQQETPYRRGEARAALGMVRGMAGDRPGALEDLSAVDSEDYGARTPRTVFAFRALVGRMTGEERLLSSALAAPDRDVRMLAEGLREEMRGDHHAAAAALALALDEPTEGYFDLVILDALARNRRALGDAAGAQAACNEIERPAIYHPYREPAVARCRAER